MIRIKETNLIHFGIDPGANGALAFITPKRRVGLYSFSKKSIADMILDIANILCGFNAEQWHCAVENVHSMPGQGVASTFTFGRNFGRIEVIAALYFNDLTYIRSNQWQKVVGITYPKGVTYKLRKTYNLRRAIKLYPKTRGLNKDTCDALLIAHYSKLTCQDQEERKSKPGSVQSSRRKRGS